MGNTIHGTEGSTVSAGIMLWCCLSFSVIERKKSLPIKGLQFAPCDSSVATDARGVWLPLLGPAVLYHHAILLQLLATIHQSYVYIRHIHMYLTTLLTSVIHLSFCIWHISIILMSPKFILVWIISLFEDFWPRWQQTNFPTNTKNCNTHGKTSLGLRWTNNKKPQGPGIRTELLIQLR